MMVMGCGLVHVSCEYLGEWQTRKVATVQRRIIELDRLVFSPVVLCDWDWDWTWLC